MITTTCSGCSTRVTLDLDAGEARVGNAVAHLFLDADDLATWDCPACEYADSHEQD